MSTPIPLRRAARALTRFTLIRLLWLGLPALALAASPKAVAPLPPEPSLPPCSSIDMAPPAEITLGKSSLIGLPSPASRLVVGGLPGGRAGKPLSPAQAKGASAPAAQQAPAADAARGVAQSDVMLLSPRQLYLLGRQPGTMNVVIQGRDGRCTVLDVTVTVDPGALENTLHNLVPEARALKVSAAQDSLILSGEMGSAAQVDRVMSVASAYAPDKKLVNMMQVGSPQQVMLDVKVAEVSKKLLDQLGAEVRARGSIGGWTTGLFSAGGSILDSAAAAVLSSKIGVFAAVGSAGRLVAIDAENDNGVAQILAEPNLLAVSGQQASFLSGGKLFIPVVQSLGAGGAQPVITLQEEDFGIGLKFTPVVLDDGNISLKVSSEVSELAQSGTSFTTVGGITAVFPTFTTRRADTTVHLGDGQSFAVAGLIKNNATESMARVPALGDLPVLGALFRSSSFQHDQTELVFVITPHLVKPLPPHYALPTDTFIKPSYTDFFLLGRMEGAIPPAPGASAASPAGGFEPAK